MFEAVCGTVISMSKLRSAMTGMSKFSTLVRTNLLKG